MGKFLIILVTAIVFSLAICFLIVLIKFRNKVLEMKENIKKHKSQVRVAQNKYVKSLQNTAFALGQDKTSEDGGGFMYGDMGSASKYNTNSSLVSDLAASYEEAQTLLNELISQYNSYICKFPNLILASILKYEKEDYIDEENLDMSTSIGKLDQSIL